MISLLCFVICLGIIASSFRRGADIFSPARVFGFTWSLTIGLTDLKLSGLQHSWTEFSWILILLGPLSFMVGVFIVFVTYIGKVMVPIDDIRKELKREPVNTEVLFRLIFVSVTLFALAFLVIYLVKGFVPMFARNPASARTEFSIFGVGVLINSMPFILLFVVLYHIIVRERAWQKLILKVLSVIAVITYFLLLQRFQIVMASVVCLALLYYLTSRIKLRTMLMYMTGVVVFFYFISSLRAGQLVQYYLYTASKMKFSPTYAIFSEPYMYLAMNLENMSRAVDRLEHFTFGYYSFDFLLALTGLKHWIGSYLALEDQPFLNSGYNSYSAFWIYYRDYGIVGVTMIPLMLGMVISGIYYSFRTSPTLRALAAYAVAIFVMMFSFFISPLGLLWFVYNIVAMIVIFKLIRRQGRRSIATNG